MKSGLSPAIGDSCSRILAVDDWKRTTANNQDIFLLALKVESTYSPLRGGS